MPMERCVAKSRPGFRWGVQGKCFTYAPNDDAGRRRARGQAERQGHAIQAARGRRE